MVPWAYELRGREPMGKFGPMRLQATWGDGGDMGHVLGTPGVPWHPLGTPWDPWGADDRVLDQ